MIAENQPAGTRHVARHDAGLAGNVPAVELGHQPHLDVDAAARRLAGEQSERFSAIVVLARAQTTIREGQDKAASKMCIRRSFDRRPDVAVRARRALVCTRSYAALRKFQG